MSKLAIASVLTLACAAAVMAEGRAAFAQAAPAAGGSQLRFDVKRTKLDNGLRVVMHVDHTSPTVAVDVVYDVGGRNEQRGRSGFGTSSTPGAIAGASRSRSA